MADGVGVPVSRKTRRGFGVFAPRDLIGTTLLDLKSVRHASEWPANHEFPELARRSTDAHHPDIRGEAVVRSSRHVQQPNAESHLDEVVFEADFDLSGPSARLEVDDHAAKHRRLKKPVVGADGQPITVQGPSSARLKPEGIRRIEPEPTPQKHWLSGSKRCFAWKSELPTLFNNPVTYDEPVEPGTRPSHPVCAIGVVPRGKEHKRAFPEKAYTITSIPPARMNKAPTGNEWGGWGRRGEPGRKVMDGPWQVEPRERELKEGEEAEFRVSDARVRLFPGQKNYDTAWLTNWHFDSRHHVDEVKKKKFSLGEPLASCSTSREQAVHRPAAGKASMLISEGTALSYYDRVRAADEDRAITAR